MKKLLKLGLTLVLTLVMVTGATIPVSASAMTNLCAQLPVYNMTFDYTRPKVVSYLTATLGGDGWLNGTYEGWCADLSHMISQEVTFTADAYCSYNLGVLPAGLVNHPDKLEEVNWILNQTWAAPYTYGDVQIAIWKLLDNTVVPAGLLADVAPYDMARIDAIIAGANANPAFEPGAGGKLVIVLALEWPDESQAQTVLITYPIPGVPQGCTPGFWKANAVNWGAVAWVGYTPGQTFSSVFGSPLSTPPVPVISVRTGGAKKPLQSNPTLLQALQANGGDINLLARSAVAALLNSTNPAIAYPLSTAQVIAKVQDTLRGVAGSLSIGNLGSYFDGLNNAGCSVNQQGQVIFPD